MGRPIRVCTKHVGVLACPHRCLGVALDSIGELQSATHIGCAVCQAPPPRAFGSRPFRILRKCHHPRCYGRFHQHSFDDLRLGDLFRHPGVWRRRHKRRFR